jgi:pimeloyl-ACP methyl ester carboxylesterase
MNLIKVWIGAWLICGACGAQQLTFGRYHSRAIFHQGSKCFAPLVVLVPGSGANGPEEMAPGAITGDGKDDSIFGPFSEGLRRGGVGTLAIGKPGVEFFSSWETAKIFYDASLYENLSWRDLLDNLDDAVAFAKTLPCVDPRRIILLGHSEGTQLVVDFASEHPDAAVALILVGFSGESLATTLDWQLFRRPIDSWLKPDVDLNHDGFISVDEAKGWPEFRWDWKDEHDKVAFSEIEKVLRASAALEAEYQKASTAKIWSGVFHRAPIYSKAAGLKQSLYVFTGTLDVQTRPEEALRMGEACAMKHKTNCEVHLVPGLGHAMSLPKAPRKQKWLDGTLGPVDESFLDVLAKVAAKLSASAED